MKAQMIQNPPPTLSKPTLLRAILDLPYSERNKLIRSVPPSTLKSLILSIPKAQQKSFYKALSSATSSPPKSSSSSPNSTNQSHSTSIIKSERDRDTELQAALNLEPSKNGYSFNGTSSNSNVDRQPKRKYITSRGTKRKLSSLTADFKSTASTKSRTKSTRKSVSSTSKR